MLRDLERFPKQGDREPWVNPQNYAKDKKMFRKAPVDDGVMQFTRHGAHRHSGVRHQRDADQSDADHQSVGR